MSKEDMMNKISFALKDPILQMGFEVICSKLSRLEKENAELKEQCSILADCNTCHSSCKNENAEMKEQLIKAKEIIKEMLSILPKENIEGIYEITEEAEQFISEVEMTKYEELMNKSDECCLKAIEFARKCDWNMATFYKNASIGFKEKALKLNVSY